MKYGECYRDRRDKEVVMMIDEGTCVVILPGLDGTGIAAGTFRRAKDKDSDIFPSLDDPNWERVDDDAS